MADSAHTVREREVACEALLALIGPDSTDPVRRYCADAVRSFAGQTLTLRPGSLWQALGWQEEGRRPVFDPALIALQGSSPETLHQLKIWGVLLHYPVGPCAIIVDVDLTTLVGCIRYEPRAPASGLGQLEDLSPVSPRAPVEPSLRLTMPHGQTPWLHRAQDETPLAVERRRLARHLASRLWREGENLAATRQTRRAHLRELVQRTLPEFVVTAALSEAELERLIDEVAMTGWTDGRAV